MMMKKMIFALLLGLGLAQVSSVNAVVPAPKESEAKTFWKKNKRMILTGLGLLISAGVVGAGAVCYKFGKPAKFKSIVDEAIPFLNPVKYSGVKKAGVVFGEVAVGFVALCGLYELGAWATQKYPSLAKKAYAKMVKDKKQAAK